MKWWTELDPAIQAAWIGVLGALVGGVLGAVLGGVVASRGALRSATKAWSFEASARAEERRERQLVRLYEGWSHVLTAAQAGAWNHMRVQLAQRVQKDVDSARQLEWSDRKLAMWGEFAARGYAVKALSQEAGYPKLSAAIAHMLSLTSHEQEEAVYAATSALAIGVLQDAEAAEERIKPDPQRHVERMVNAVMRGNAERDATSSNAT